MKNSEPNGFHLQSQAVCYGGRDGFTKMDSAEIPRIKKSVFGTGAKERTRLNATT